MLKMKDKLLTFLPLILIVVLGIILRTVMLNSSPPSLNEDEAALGYNAYSLLKTARDEHGVFLPFSLESFGDWKLPVYSYSAILPIALFGLSEFSTRLPSILAGVLGIIIIYFITQRLFFKRSVSILSAFFFAVSPWSIFFSRAAYEVNLATTLFLGGLLLFLKSIGEKNRHSIYLLFSGILFGFTLFTYHSYIIFVPLFSAFLVIYFIKKLKRKIAFFIFPLLVFILVSFVTSYLNSSVKFSTTTILTNKNVIYNRVENFKKDTLLNPPIFDRIHTKYLGVPYQILQNYLLSFSPVFLFDRGGEKLVHNLDGFGNIYIFDALLLMSGVAGLFYFREKRLPILIFWLIVAPIPSALTIDAPNSTRLFILMPLFSIISGYGAWFLIELFKKNIFGRISLIILLIFFVNVTYFLNLYFIHFGYHRARFWHYGFKQVVEISNKYSNYNVIMRGPEDFPYIYFLFYNKFDPEKFQREAVYYSITWDGFRYVKKFGRYEFDKTIDYEKTKANTLYIDNRGFTDKSKTIFLPDGDPILMWQVK